MEFATIKHGTVEGL